ncbi:hypothetical protein MPOCJGCO_0251 [Methylobacterium trifolii]|uniref:Uncharacterized protein n=1 Tax=Methylobacterium trifolii TaxID=1003092 RepID=A0ABQ4TTT5_9HYPH|nr:hypothetical protein MPOCJGCO_0251 [Methylobacterium trifolii]
MRRGGQRDVPLAAEQARRGVEPDPAGAGQVDLGPGVQVGEVGLGALRPVHGRGVGHELDQVAGDEAGGEPDPAQHLHQEPGRVAAGAALQGQGLGGRLHARLHAHAVGDLARHEGVQRHQELHRGRLRRQAREEGVDLRAAGVVEDEVGGEFPRQVRVVGEGPRLRVLLHEEVERVDHRHLGGEVHLDPQLVRLLREDEAGEPVAVGVLLPVQEVVLGRDLQGVGRDLGARVRRRAQADRLRPEADRTVVAVVGDVVQGGFDRHGHSRLEIERARRASLTLVCCRVLWGKGAAPSNFRAALVQDNRLEALVLVLELGLNRRRPPPRAQADPSLCVFQDVILENPLRGALVAP